MMTGSLYAALFCAMTLFLLIPGRSLGTAAGALVLGGLFCALLIPIEGVNGVMAIRAVTGDLSLFSVYWLACSCAGRLGAATALIPRSQTIAAATAVTAGALLLYPATLGLSQWDPYRLGYGIELPLACGILVLAFYVAGQRFTAMALSLCLAAYAGGLLESTNLWDYLLDPWLVGYCFYLLARNWRGLLPAPVPPDGESR